MTTPNLEQIIADALRVLPSPIAAEPFEPGWWRSCVTWEEIVEKAAPAVVAAIRDSGLAVIALPEADQRWPGIAEWATPHGGVTAFTARDDVRIHDWEHSSADALELGAALLAAAQASESKVGRE